MKDPPHIRVMQEMEKEKGKAKRYEAQEKIKCKRASEGLH